MAQFDGIVWLKLESLNLFGIQCVIHFSHFGAVLRHWPDSRLIKAKMFWMYNINLKTLYGHFFLLFIFYLVPEYGNENINNETSNKISRQTDWVREIKKETVRVDATCMYYM